MRTYSFDIFDTCLGRICGDPRNIFDILAIKVLGSEANDACLNDFRLARVNGELLAAKISDGKEITIDDIYAHSDFTTLTSLCNDKIKELEIETEEENLFAIFETLQKVNKIHEKGCPVLYISDMYLPSSFLVKVLEREGFWKEGDKIYVSCENEATKSGGSLFKIVKEKEKLYYFNWTHEGDNRRSDFRRPLRMGILAKRFSCEYSHYQKKFKENCLSTSSRIGSIVPGICRSIVHGEEKNERVLFSADIIAPVYVPFVYKTLWDAHIRGIQRLYFLARDGYIFLKIAEVFKSLFPDVECHYLYVSRKSLYLPSVESIDDRTISSLLMRASSVEECTDSLQLELTEEEKDYLKHCSSIQKGLLESETIKKKLIEHWIEQKDNCIKYFVQEGLASKDGKSAIVDLRGSRRSQISINNILKRNGYSPVFAYYLEVTRDRMIANDAYFSQYFTGTTEQMPQYCGLKDGKYILEHYFSITPFQRTSHYKLVEGRVEPVFDAKEIVHSEAESICNINIRCCLIFAKRLLLLQQGKEISNIIEPGLSVFSSFAFRPKKLYLRALTNVNTSQTQFKSRKLIRRVGLLSLFQKSTSWYEGSFMYTYGIIGWWSYKKIISKCAKVLLKK